MDNSQAFPIPGYEPAGWEPTPGMTLRDYFAAKAIPCLAHEYLRECPAAKMEAQCAALAKECYQVADAMLEARNK